MEKNKLFERLKEVTDVVKINTGFSDLGEKYKPEVLVNPKSIEEIKAIVKMANEYKTPIYPIGSGSRFGQGVDPFQGGILLSVKNLDQIIEYRPNNMSVEVEAGMTITNLQNILAQDNIFFPVDSGNNRATIGGLIATNSYGRKKYLYKTTRFYVMGMEFVSPQGELIRVGGRTIKNVSSYDINQLLAGSWGVLGIITKATLRVKPKPEKNLLLNYNTSDFTELIKMIKSILINEKLSLASLVFEKLNSNYLLQLELEGFADTINFQQGLLKEKYGFKDAEHSIFSETIGPGIISLPLKNYTQGLEEVDKLTNQFSSMKIKGNITSGIINFEISANNELLLNLSRVINTLQGTLTFEGNMLTTKNRGTGYLNLLKNIKKNIDPNNILVPTSKALKEQV
jgi:glycolate oxidase